MGKPKAWLPFGPERLLTRVVRLVSVVADDVTVVAAPAQSLPPLPRGVRLAFDPIPGRGPLQGLGTGLDAVPAEVELVYATATDAPFLQPAWVTRLVELIGPADLAIPEVDGRLHPLAALYRRAAVRAAVERLLRADQLRTTALVSAVRARIVTAAELRSVDPTLQTLRNLNTPEEYARALRDAGVAPPGTDPR